MNFLSNCDLIRFFFCSWELFIFFESNVRSLCRVLVTEIFTICKSWSLHVRATIFDCVLLMEDLFLYFYEASFIPKRCLNFGAPHLSTVFHLIKIFRLISHTFLWGTAATVYPMKYRKIHLWNFLSVRRSACS